MSDGKLRAKLVCITQTTLGQHILDRAFWQKLENPLGWRLASYTGQLSADFYTLQTTDGVWTGLSPVTPWMRYSLLTVLGHEDIVRAEQEQAAQTVAIPLAPIVPFPNSK